MARASKIPVASTASGRSVSDRQLLTERAPEPIVGRDIEAGLHLRFSTAGGQFIAHQFAGSTRFWVKPRIFSRAGSPAAKSTMRGSRNGGRTSSGWAMLMRSVLYKMSSGR